MKSWSRQATSLVQAVDDDPGMIVPATPEALIELDLRGLLCPLTWARTRYALQQLETGHTLRVLVDHRPAVPDIKRNTEDLGHEVISAREIDARAALPVWELVLR